MIHRTHVVTVVICVVTLMTLGVGWFAFGQIAQTNTPPELTPGMEAPLVKDVNLEREVKNLAARVDVLETTVDRLKNELNEIKKKSDRDRRESNKNK